jgi:L-ascorbate metabolism protein UlaG (beta-lactamase superfamily)
MTTIDYMLLPIGDNFTMGITDAVKAAELVNPKLAIPMHYSTFPVINADPNQFKKATEAKGISCKVLKYGEEITL